MSQQLTHLDAAGNASMVDVTAKPATGREAVAAASVRMSATTLAMIEEGMHAKGDVLTVARVAGIQAAKKCAELIPLCHPLMLTSVKLDISTEREPPSVVIRAC